MSQRALDTPAAIPEAVPVTAYIALGGNLGDPIGTQQSALEALDALPGIQLLKVSSYYRTAPVGLAAQPDFINAVASLETTLSAPALLETLLDTERQFGRIRQQLNGPRTLDLDLLLYGDLVCTTPTLTLPHPRLHLRAFVLLPLAEIAPDLPLPGRGSVAAWLPAVANQQAVRM